MEAIVSGLIRTLATPETKEFTLLWNRKGKMVTLQNDLEMIQAVLSDAEEKKHKEKQVQTWLSNLGEVAYDAVDVFDEVNMEVALHPERESEVDVGVSRHFVRLVSACFLSCFTDIPNPIVFHHQMGSRIEDIMARLSDLKGITALMGIINRPNQSVSSNTRETSSLLDKHQPFLGRDEEKQQLIKELCASDDDCVPSLVSVVGMGGVGKTTIAQVLYNDDKINEHFSCLVKWVFVGEKFDAQKIVEELLSDDSKRKIGSDPTLDKLQRLLISDIKDQKFFIVLDDVWNEKPKEWEPLWRPLQYGAKGSKVLITTRSEVVAKVKDPSSPILKLEGLSHDVCWSIFERIAFVGGSSEGHPVLKDIGMEIVKKLEGIPLAAELIGGALNGNFTETYWRRLMDSEIWSDNLKVVGVLPSLLLSYQALPAHLKLCFQFCSLFPKDHKFDRETLVWMWMAHDYVKPIGDERVEDVGSRYFDELLHRSFFQHINDSYVMHDLIHDLAQFVSDGQCLRVEDKKQLGSKQFNRIHHLSLFFEDGLEAKDLHHQFNRTRTLLHSRAWGNLTVASDAILCQLLGRLRCIRVLSLYKCDGIESLPECISNLKHLRYLDLSNTSIKKLPESLCTLYNLQTLMLPHNNLLPPKGMSKLVNLRNLRAHENYFSKIAGIGKLTCLQELKWPFKVSKEKNEGRNLGELKGMNQLRGTLRIQNLENLSNVEEAEGIQLKDKVFLHRLELNRTRCVRENEYSDSSEDDVIEALQPPQQLKEMKLVNHPDSQPPIWLPLLTNLVVLELYYCKNYTSLPSGMGRLPCLKSLDLVGMSGIKQVGPEFHCCGNGSDVVAFPSLEHLRFKYMAELERWVIDGSGGVVEGGEIEDFNRELGRGDEQRRRPPCHKQPLRCGAFPHLRSLHFESCPKLATISGLLRHHNLNSLEQVFIRKCKELVQLFGDGEEGGKGKLPLHNGPPMLKALDIFECPKLTWSEVEPLFLLLATSSTSLRALRICLDAENQHDYYFNEVLINRETSLEKEMALGFVDAEHQHEYHVNQVLINRETSLEKEMAVGFVGSNKRELLSWLLQQKRNPLLKSLQYLEVINCDELTSFTEEEEQEFCGRNLPSLLYLTFYKCPNLRSLPAGLGHISSLTNLSISDCPQIHSLAVPPLLQTLNIYGCPQLAEVTWGEMQPDLIGSSYSLPSSSSLSSSSTRTLAPQLRSVGTDNGRVLTLAPQLRRVRTLAPQLRSVGTDNGRVLTLAPQLRRVRTLAPQPPSVGTDNGRVLSCLLLQPGRLEFLRTLGIHNCEELMTFTEEEQEFCGRNLSLPAGLGHISSLTVLSIEDCPQIHSLAVPPLLQTLRIYRCPQLAKVTWGEMQPDLIGSSYSLPSSSSSLSTRTLAPELKRVGTDNGRVLSWLLLQPRRLEFLRWLEISDCEELMTFTEEEKEGWRQNLPSLEYLDILDCPNLCSLPEGLNIKPGIVIQGCPKLEAPPARPALH